ncbi:MAG TPA: hypothetical protein VG168_04345, partial [Bryobacteraceae bacterium]|nr:hypothetical protein [Bryobacteraceae bacterium]
IADVIALSADPELIFDVQQSLRELLRVLAWGAQQMERYPLRRFLTDAGEALAFLNQPRERLREIGHAGRD